MGETILILGRISWNGSKRRDFETFHWGITAERFIEMNCGVETGRMVFHTDSCPSTLYLAMEFKVFAEDLPPLPYPFTSGSCCQTPSLKLRLWLLLPTRLLSTMPTRRSTPTANRRIRRTTAGSCRPALC
jgi:hypothetical protein